MLMPAPLPLELRDCENAKDELSLFNNLVQRPQDLILFFEIACSNETWCLQFKDFMHDTIPWITEQVFSGNLSFEIAQRAAKAIQEHFYLLQNHFSLNLIFKIKEKQVPGNSLLFSASSLFFHQMIQSECSNFKQSIIAINKLIDSDDVSYEEFLLIQEFVHTGKVEKLWFCKSSDLFRLLRRSLYFGLEKLALLCEEILKVYIDQDNVFDLLVTSHREGWLRLKQNCIDFVNNLQLGVMFYSEHPEQLSLEFKEFNTSAMATFERFVPLITHLIFTGSLIEDPLFSDIIHCCPKLISLEVGRSRRFSDYLLNIPAQLRILDLSLCVWLTPVNMRNIFTHAPFLESIYLRGNSHLNYLAWKELKHLEQLKTLNLAQCHQITDEDFQLILKSVTGLTELNIEGCKKLTDRAFFELTKQLSNLSILVATRCEISDPLLLELSLRCRQLSFLNLKQCERITEKGILTAVANASKLQHLILTHTHISKTLIETLKKKRPYIQIEL